MNFVTLHKEMIIAMKNRDKLRKDTISSLVEAVKKAAIDKKCRENIPDSLVEEVLLKEQKNMQEMIDTCPVDREKKPWQSIKQKWRLSKSLLRSLLQMLKKSIASFAILLKKMVLRLKKKTKAL